MELTEAQNQARLIFENEQNHPTLNYRYISSEWPEEMKYEQNPSWSAAGAGMMALPRIRKRLPRKVYENPNNWQLESANYTLIMAIYSQLSETNRGLFLGGSLNVWTRKYIPSRMEAQHWWPSWNGHTSALPLLAEFCIRNGQLKLLLDVLKNVEMPTASVAVMFAQFSEMITLNFNVFTDAELAAMPEALKPVREMADAQTWQSRRPRGVHGQTETNPRYKEGFRSEGAEIVRGIDAFLVQCQEARYWYVKGVLLQARNPEIEGDKTQVISYLERLGFTDNMRQSLNVAEQNYRGESDGFELKTCLGHLRSFLEQLHIQACIPIAVSISDPAPPEKWGKATAYLRTNGILSQMEEAFVTSLYTLVSDEAIHPSVAQREYARIRRNMIIEYGLLFLSVLDKRGFKVS
jgi:hypothetical protein